MTDHAFAIVEPGDEMSDQQGFTPQPPQMPAAPPQPPSPPAGYSAPVAPPPAYGAPPQPAPKKRGVLTIVIVAVLLLVCVPAACVGAFAVSEFSSRAKTREAVVQAETHYNAAMDAVSRASDALGAEGATADAEALTEIASATTAELRTARDEIAAARAAVEPLEDSEGRTAYLGSLDAATDALEALDGLMGTLERSGEVVTRVSEASTSASKARNDLNAAVKAGNSSKYSTMRSKALAASSKFSEAASVFDLAHDVDPTAELDKAADYMRAMRKQADLVVKMADDGKAGRTSAYNAKIKELNALQSDAKKIGDPAILEDPNWFATGMTELAATVDEASTRADTLHAQALSSFGLAD